MGAKLKPMITREGYTKATLIAALQALECPDDTPVMYMDAEWQESQVKYCDATSHTLTGELIIVLDQD